MEDKEHKEISIADLYPGLSPEEQEEAEYRLVGYLMIVRSIWDRYEQEGKLDALIKEIKRYRKSRK